MKHKGERNIPDFSRKPKPAPGAAAPNAKPAAAPVQDRAVKPQPKPHATSAKSGGRRGP
jgi:hypothetical protein